jgi:16S rRNA (guanine(527)-N(7))-methyltransferase RsmG
MSGTDEAGAAARVQAALLRAGETEPFAADCARHFALLLKWNRTHNLTRITDPEEAASRHYLDCARGVDAALSVASAPEALVDVGSGAGFPGVIAALRLRLRGRAPALTLVEPARKRVSFLQVVCRELGLAVRVVPPSQTPTAPEGTGPWWVTCRATFSAGERVALRPYRGEGLRPGGILCAWTTPHELATWQAELATWGFGATTAPRYSLHVAGGPPHGSDDAAGAAELERVVLVCQG